MIMQIINNKGRILKYAIIIFFLNRLLTLEFLNYYPVMGEIYVLVSGILTVWYCFKFFYVHSRKNHLYVNEVGVVLLIAIYFTYAFFNTLFHDGSVRRVIMTAYPIIGSLCFIEVESRNHYDELIRGFNFFLVFFVIVNFWDMIFIRHALTGLTTTTFMVGGKNQLAVLLSVALAFYCVICQEQEKKQFFNLKSIAYLLVITMSAVLSTSSTCMITITAVILLYILMVVKKKGLLVNPTGVMIIYVVSWFALIVFRIHYLFADLLRNWFHKDLTLSHRTIIWDRALELIVKKPVFGYGLTESLNVFSVHHDYTGGNNNVWTALSGHNQFLQLLYYGGIVLMMMFFAIYFVSTKKKRRNNYHFKYYFLGVIGILINWMSEVPSEYAMFLMLGICYFSERSLWRSVENESELQINQCYRANIQGREIPR